MKEYHQSLIVIFLSNQHLITTSLLHLSLSSLSLRLPLIMNLPPLVFLLAITLNSSAYTPNSTLCAIRHSLSPVFNLALCFLSFTLFVLVDSSAAEVFVAGYITDGFFGRADGLVPFWIGGGLIGGGCGCWLGVCGGGLLEG